MKKTLVAASSALLAIAFVWAFIPPAASVDAQQKKISQLTEDTAPTTDDLVNTVNNPGGTPASRKATLANVTKGLNVSNLTTGTVPTARLGSGTANSSTYLRGDQTWATPSTSAAGSNTQIQFNNSGSLAGASTLVYASSEETVSNNPGGSETEAFGVGAGSPSMSGPYNTGVGYASIGSITSGAHNTAIGRRSILAATTAYNNSGLGSGSLSSLTTGYENTAVGYEAVNTVTTGAYNTGIGSQSLTPGTSGTSNTALGAKAGASLSGNNNLLLGYEAGMSSTGSNNVFIGFETGKSQAVSDSLFIDNSNTSTPLIGGNFSTNAITINGSLKVGSSGMAVNQILTGSATLDFPSSMGEAQDLTITVTGAATSDVVSLGVPNGSVTSNGIFQAWVSAADTVTVRFFTTNIAGENPASGTFKVLVTQF